jgi:hypothetical protein
MASALPNTPSRPELVHSVAVHWPRFFAAAAVATVVIAASATAPAAAPVWDSAPLSLALIGVVMFLILAVGRPHADFELTPEGIRRREALVHRWARRTSVIPWGDVAEHAVTEELDGSRALVVRARDGRSFKVWERTSSGATLDDFYAGLRRGLERNQASTPVEPRSIPVRKSPGVRILVALLVVAWVALAIATLLWPPERVAVRLAALAVQALLIAPMAARVLVTRRTRE